MDVNGILNNDERALLITNIYKIFMAPALTIITPLLSFLIPIILFFWFQRKTGIKLNWSMLSQIFMKILFGADSFQLLFKNPTKAVIANLCTKGLYLFLYFQNIYYSIQSAKSTVKVIDLIHVRLNHMSAYVKKMHQLIECAKKHHIDKYYDSTIDLTLEKCDLYIQNYASLFRHDLFESVPSLFNHKGRILYTYQYFNRIKNDFIHLFHFVGMFDAFHSLGKLISTSTESHPYTFTKYTLKSTPYIDFENIWHPYLTKKTQLNSLHIGNQHILITGPNAAGKSTFIKAVIVNILLSQTLGISSSSSFEMTPFKMIETYLQIPDAKGVASLFEAEMLRSKQYIDKLKKMKDHEYSFIVLDEIFSSTNYIEGFSGAYAILKKIASFPNTLSMTTTHYSDLEYLEKDTKNIKNYHFEIVRNPETKEIQFNYRLQPGVSRTYIALELLRNHGFDEDLIDDAIAMSKRIVPTFMKNDEKEEVKDEKMKEGGIKRENESSQCLFYQPDGLDKISSSMSQLVPFEEEVKKFKKKRNNKRV
jgi:predicted kinase